MVRVQTEIKSTGEPGRTNAYTAMSGASTLFQQIDNTPHAGSHARTDLPVNNKPTQLPFEQLDLRYLQTGKSCVPLLCLVM